MRARSRVSVRARFPLAPIVWWSGRLAIMLVRACVPALVRVHIISPRVEPSVSRACTFSHRIASRAQSLAVASNARALAALSHKVALSYDSIFALVLCIICVAGQRARWRTPFGAGSARARVHKPQHRTVDIKRTRET